MDPAPAVTAGEEALRDAYRYHGRAVYAVAARVCGPMLAEDVTQEVFLRFWRHPGRFEPARGSLRTFLLTLAHHGAVDALRSGEARRRREGRIDPSAPVAPDVEHQVEGADTAARIAAALDSIPAVERQAIVTAFYGRCSYREAAVVLGEAEGTIKSRIRSGLGHLAAVLGDGMTLTIR